MKNEEERAIERRINKLERDSHPPVNWKEIIYANTERIGQLEMDNSELMEIIKHLTLDNKDLKSRIDILEEILSNWLPIIEKEKE